MDPGCGTGISTRLFATTGHPVIGIDPNADMLATTLAANPLASAQTAPPTSSATTASASTPRGRSLCASSSDDDQLGACFAARTPHCRKSFCTAITAPCSSVIRMQYSPERSSPMGMSDPAVGMDPERQALPALSNTANTRGDRP